MVLRWRIINFNRLISYIITMATIITHSEGKTDCIKHYVETSLDYVRMVEHKLTEVLECLGSTDIVQS